MLVVAMLCTASDSQHSPSARSTSSDAERSIEMPAAAAGGGRTLVLTCPDTAKLFCGDSTDPSVTGTPTVSGGCDNHPVVTYQDVIVPTPCPADRFDHVIQRTWTAHDSCGNIATCVQRVDVLKTLVFFDMHTTSCPNPVNTTGNGVIPAAILGTANFDVTQIDPNSIELWQFQCDGGPAVPIQSFHLQDTATPYTGNTQCGCNTLHGDGFVDLNIKFNRQQVVSALHLTTYPQFTFVHVAIVGKLTNGCGFIGLDCIRVQ
jgi:hypothetical protein